MCVQLFVAVYGCMYKANKNKKKKRTKCFPLFNENFCEKALNEIATSKTDQTQRHIIEHITRPGVYIL